MFLLRQDPREYLFASMGPRVLKVLCLGFILGGIQRTVAEREVTTCSSAPVAVGERGEMVFHLAPHIVQTADSMYMYIRKDGEPDALSCHKADTNSSMECSTPNRHFWSEGAVGHQLTLVAPKATRDVEGVYVLRVYVNGTMDPITSCNFTIIENRASNDKDSSVVVPVVVSVILVVVIGVIVAVAVFRYRKGSMCQSKLTQGHGQPSLDAAQEMTATVQIAPGEDAPFIQTGVSVETQTTLTPIVPTTSDDSMATALQVFAGGELRLLLVGPAASGKSASGNTILGRETFDSHRGLIFSTQCDWKQAVRHNILIKVTDTPAVGNPSSCVEEVHKELAKGLATVAPGPHAILVMLRCDQRFTAYDYAAYKTLKQVIGESMTDFMIVVFTGLNWLDETRLDELLDKTLPGSPNVKQILDDAHGRYIGFNNNLPMSERVLQGDRLIELVAKMSGGKYYTKQ